jgi:hypothetical protein
MMDSLEQKLKHYEQSIFGMQEYIETKLRETDFQSTSPPADAWWMEHIECRGSVPAYAQWME